MKLFKRTDIGKRRENQDTIDNQGFETGVLGLVCDGMGGGINGKEASRRAVNRFISVFDKNYSPDMTEFRDVLTVCMQEANTVVYDEAKIAHSNGSMMGTTCVGAFVTNDLAHIVNIGDSRAYLVDSEKITQITTDHSVVRLMYERGEISYEDMKNHPDKNVLLRVLGVEENVKADYFKVRYGDGMILLCSDGLTNAVDDEDIFDICKENPLNSVATMLVEQAIVNGGSDNISVIVISK